MDFLKQTVDNKLVNTELTENKPNIPFRLQLEQHVILSLCAL